MNAREGALLDYANFTAFAARELRVGFLRFFAPIRFLLGLRSQTSGPSYAGLRLTPMIRRGIALAGVAAATTFFLWSQPSIGEIRTAVGAQRSISLPGGTQVDLNTDTRVGVGLGARRVELLAGEAWFAVTAHVGAPFILVAGNQRLEVFDATHFSVRVEADTLIVTVRDGAVGILPERDRLAEPLRLERGSRYERRNGHTKVVTLSDDDILRSLAWRDGMLWFERETLREVLNEVERHTGAHFTISDPALASTHVTAYFRATNVEVLLARIEELDPDVVVHRLPNNTFLISRRSGLP